MLSRYFFGSLSAFRQINTVKYIVQNRDSYSIDISDVDPLIVQSVLASDQQTKYYVKRTVLGKLLPVYVRLRCRRSRVATDIRRIDGDASVLQAELGRFIPMEKVKLNSLTNNIRISNGNYKDAVCKYLTLKGY